MHNRTILLILTFIFVAAFILRFFKLGEIPAGFYQDESAIGYNAYSIMNTARDEHGNFLPLYFKSFGDYKLPVYIYLSIIPISVFGLSEFAVRFPSAFFGFLTVISFYFFVKELSGDKVLALLSIVLLTINPWHLHYSRATFEVSIALFLFVTGATLLYKSFNNKNFNTFMLGTLLFVISLYSYNLTRLLAPLLYCLIILFNKDKFRITLKRKLITAFLIIILLLLPFMITFLQKGGVTSASGTLIFSSAAVQAPLIELRSYFISLSAIFTKLFFSQIPLTIWQYLNNIAAYFSPSFWFIAGSPHGNHGIGNIGQFYLFEMPFILIGIEKMIRKKIKWGIFLIMWTVVVIAVASLTREVPHATRSYFLVVSLEVFSAFGVITLLSWLNKIKRSDYKIAIFTAYALFIVYNVVFYFSSYYIRFPVLYAESWRARDKDVSIYIKENLDKYNKVIIDNNSGFVYASYLFYSKYSPSEFHISVTREPDDSEGFSMVKSFGKFQFETLDWSKYNDYTKTLIITKLEKKPERLTPVKVFFYPQRPIVLSVKQEIVNYPVEEPAYALIESLDL